MPPTTIPVSVAVDTVAVVEPADPLVRRRHGDAAWHERGRLRLARPSRSRPPTIVESVLVHVAAFVTSSVELSVKTAVAVKRWLMPTGTVEFAGVTCTLITVGTTTVSIVLPETPEYVAVTVTPPALMPVARPRAPPGPPLLMVATVGIGADPARRRRDVDRREVRVDRDGLELLRPRSWRSSGWSA